MLPREIQSSKWSVQKPTSKDRHLRACHDGSRRNLWRNPRRTPSPDISHVSRHPATLHDSAPSLWPSQGGFLNHPSAALSVGMLGIAKSCFTDRIPLLETLDSKPVPGDTIQNRWSPSITLRVTLVGKKTGWEINACTLLDSRAEGIIIDQDSATRNKLTLRTLVNPLPVKTVDGTLNKRGSVCFTTIQHIHIKTLEDHYHEELSELYVTTRGDHNIIFGTDWLHSHPPEVDWTLPQVAFTHCPASCTLSQKPLVITSRKTQTCTTTINVIQPSQEVPDMVDALFSQEAMENFLYMHSFAEYGHLAISAKTTTSTEIAARTVPKSSLDHIPVKFRNYRGISEEASHRLPSHQPWDHVIDLKPGATMKNCGIYRLTPRETVALKIHIKEGKHKGHLCPSKSPMASPFIFIDKKDGNPHQVQDYWSLNEMTIKNAVPLPLIPELIDKLHRVHYYTRFDVCWGYNNIHIEEGDEWKAAFKTPLGQFEPIVMTFGLCNAPETFQTFMNNILKTWLMQDRSLSI